MSFLRFVRLGEALWSGTEPLGLGGGLHAFLMSSSSKVLSVNLSLLIVVALLLTTVVLSVVVVVVVVVAIAIADCSTHTRHVCRRFRENCSIFDNLENLETLKSRFQLLSDRIGQGEITEGRCFFLLDFYNNTPLNWMGGKKSKKIRLWNQRFRWWLINQSKLFFQ